MRSKTFIIIQERVPDVGHPPRQSGKGRACL